ncbi:hypothetical protein H4R33_002690 [Dimargaris cristalligena]|nr:hypothetical protein H4R33_002690 [Dimargaris cristalligena]
MTDRLTEQSLDELDALFQELVTLDDIQPRETVPRTTDLSQAELALDMTSSIDTHPIEAPLDTAVHPDELDEERLLSSMQNLLANAQRDPYLTQSLHHESPGPTDAVALLAALDRQSSGLPFPDPNNPRDIRGDGPSASSTSTAPVSEAQHHAALMEYIGKMKRELPGMHDFFDELVNVPAESAFFAPSFFPPPATNAPTALELEGDGAAKKEGGNIGRDIADADADTGAGGIGVGESVKRAVYPSANSPGSLAHPANEIIQMIMDDLRLSEVQDQAGEAQDTQLLARLAELRNHPPHPTGSARKAPATTMVPDNTNPSTVKMTDVNQPRVIDINNTASPAARNYLFGTNQSFTSGNDDDWPDDSSSEASDEDSNESEISDSDGNSDESDADDQDTENFQRPKPPPRRQFLSLNRDDMANSTTDPPVVISPGSIIEVQPVTHHEPELLGAAPDPADLRDLLHMSQQIHRSPTNAHEATLPTPEKTRGNLPAEDLQCWICSDQATLACIECDGDAFCQDCFTQFHHSNGADRDLASHKFQALL